MLCVYFYSAFLPEMKGRLQIFLKKMNATLDVQWTINWIRITELIDSMNHNFLGKVW